jgi:hypothetical protein
VSRKIILALALLAFPRFARADSEWILVTSRITYHVSHPLHQSEGISREAKGKGVCHAGQCDFLIAVPVKSFDSGDSNRDLHMVQVARGGQFPMITVRTHLPESASSLETIQADLEVQFAGQTMTYSHIDLHREMTGSETLITGVIPLTLTDFKIDPPTLMAIPVKNEIPVRVQMRWRPM